MRLPDDCCMCCKDFDFKEGFLSNGKGYLCICRKRDLVATPITDEDFAVLAGTPCMEHIIEPGNPDDLDPDFTVKGLTL